MWFQGWDKILMITLISSKKLKIIVKDLSIHERLLMTSRWRHDGTVLGVFFVPPMFGSLKNENSSNIITDQSLNSRERYYREEVFKQLYKIQISAEQKNILNGAVVMSLWRHQKTFINRQAFSHCTVVKLLFHVW